MRFNAEQQRMLGIWFTMRQQSSNQQAALSSIVRLARDY